MKQLVIEQLIHYFTTYGFEQLGIYDKDSVYVPTEKLDIPELKEDIKLTVINGYSSGELKQKLFSLLGSGIALKESTVDDVVDAATYLGIKETDIDKIRNKEARVMLYDYLDLLPEDPIEFLRCAIYRSTGRTLLIKNDDTIEDIRKSKNIEVLGLFNRYKKKYELANLAQIFYRFKPLFLAFRTNKRMKVITNKLRRLAKKHHKPIKEDYLNQVTARIRAGTADVDRLYKELAKANIFRKIRLAYALNYRAQDDIRSIVYRVRNGKSHATDFGFDNKARAQELLEIVKRSIIYDISKGVNNETIHIPDHVHYALPATEKQFTGDFPSGTYITVPEDMVIGVHWQNMEDNRIDLDLSMINSVAKIGWNTRYRASDRSVLFSGDMTDGIDSNGASELFYIKKLDINPYIVMLNYYNYNENITPVFKLFVAQEHTTDLEKNHTIDPNNVLSVTKSSIGQKQNVLGLLVPTTNECRFYYAQTQLGLSITSSDAPVITHCRNYLFDYYENMIGLKEILAEAGYELVDEDDEPDIDLSPGQLERDKIIDILRNQGD